MNDSILLVDDEREMRKLLQICLAANPYQVDEASNGEEAFKKIINNHYNLVILDIMMPEVDGFELLKKLKKEYQEQIPVILLSALGDTERVVKGLNLGADDYIVKPFEPKELVARVESVLRRSKKVKSNIDTFTIKGLLFNQDSYQVQYKNNVIPLTKKEFQIFCRLANNPGRVYSRDDLLELEWGMLYDGDIRTVDTHIKNIREKLNAVEYNDTIIETVWGIGYKVIE